MRIEVHCPAAYDRALQKQYECGKDIDLHMTLTHRIAILASNWGDDSTLHLYEDFAPYSLAFVVEYGDGRHINGCILFTENQGWSSHT